MARGRQGKRRSGWGPSRRKPAFAEPAESESGPVKVYFDMSITAKSARRYTSASPTVTRSCTSAGGDPAKE